MWRNDRNNLDSLIMVYGKLLNGNIEYFKPYKGGILVGDKIVFTKSESIYNKYGWYKVQEITGDGEDCVENDVLYHYLGTPTITEQEESEYEYDEESAYIAD